MVFKKILLSDGKPVIIGTISEEDVKFPPGFTYRIGSIIYTVKENVTQDTASPMREVILSDGSTEIISVESITRDLKESDCDILPMDERFSKNKVIKKKIIKNKKTKKKVKNNVSKDPK